VTSIHEFFSNAGVNQLGLTPEEQVLFKELSGKLQPIFDNACAHNPDRTSYQMLLGTLTQTHIQHTAQLEHHLQSILAMQQAINDGVGEEHAQKFKTTAPTELLLITKLWIMVQGFLKMDFSLANDHAANSASLVNSLLGADPEVLRTEIMKSFYVGWEASPIEDRKPNLFDKLKAWFS